MECEKQEVGDTYRKVEEPKGVAKIRKISGEQPAKVTDNRAAGRVGNLTREKELGREENRRGRPINAERLQRDRSSSVGSILDFFRRKREREIEEEKEGEEKATRKRYNSTTLQLNSPIEYKEGREQSELVSMDIEKLKGMSDVKDMIVYLATGLNAESSALRKDVNMIRQGLEKEREADRKRMDALERKIENKFKSWEKEIEEIKNDKKYKILEERVNELTGKKDNEVQGR